MYIMELERSSRLQASSKYCSQSDQLKAAIDKIDPRIWEMAYSIRRAFLWWPRKKIVIQQVLDYHLLVFHGCCGRRKKNGFLLLFKFCTGIAKWSVGVRSKVDPNRKIMKRDMTNVEEIAISISAIYSILHDGRKAKTRRQNSNKVKRFC